MLYLQSVFAIGGKHDFSAEVWSNGKSCLICHSLSNDLPKVSPPGSRVVDLTKLEAQEQAAYDSNSSNVTCFVCHQAQHSFVAPKTNSSTTITLPAPKVPPVYTGGTEGGANIRVINRGTNSLDCLQCHDLHNDDSLKMLKADYFQN
jgi:hypothetical protein